MEEEEFTAKKLIPSGKYHKLFLLLAIIETIAVLVLTFISLRNALETNSGNDSYLAVIILASSVFYIYFGFHGIYNSNIFEILAFIFALALVEAYIVYRYVNKVISDQLDLVQHIGLAVISLLSILFVLVLIKLLPNLNQWRFKKVPQSLEKNSTLRSLYRWYEAWSALLIVDVQFGIVLALMGLFFFFTPAEIIINVVLIFFIFVWPIIGRVAIRMEDKKWLFAFLLFSVVQPADVIEKFVRFNSGNVEFDTLPLPQIIFALVAALIVRVVLLICTIKLGKGFGSGLYEKVFHPEEEEEPVVNILVEKEVKPRLTLAVRKMSRRNIQDIFNEPEEQPKQQPQEQTNKESDTSDSD